MRIRQYALLSSVLFPAALIYLLSGEQKERKEAGSTTPPNSANSLGPPASSDRDPGTVTSHPAPKPNADALTNTESDMLQNTLDRLQSEFRTVEVANAAVAFQKESETGSSLILRLTPPTAAQLGPINDWLSKARRQFPPGSLGEKEFSRQVDIVFSNYATYHGPYRVLSLSLRNDSPNGELFEFYAKNATDGIPDEKGNVKVPSNRSIKFDHNYGAEKSWAVERYKHLFVSEKLPPKANGSRK